MTRATLPQWISEEVDEPRIADWHTSRLIWSTYVHENALHHARSGEWAVAKAARTFGLMRLAQTIQESAYLYDLNEDWDGEGARGYDLATWLRMATFANAHATLSMKMLGSPIPIPRVGPADNGSIDLHWILGDRTLLINFPSSPGDPPTFYGKRRGGDVIAGEIHHEDRADLVVWLNA